VRVRESWASPHSLREGGSTAASDVRPALPAWPRAFFRIYDDRDAEEHLSFLEGYYDPEEDREALAAMPDRKNILPPCMNQRPLGRGALKAILARMAPRNRVLRLLKATLELDRISRSVRFPEVPEPVRDLFSDCNPAVPILLAIYRQGDAIEACFDEERQSMLEQTPEPWPLIPFDGTDPTSTKLAFGCLKRRASGAGSRSPGTRTGAWLGSRSGGKVNDHDENNAFRLESELWPFEGHPGLFGRPGSIRDRPRAQRLAGWRAALSRCRRAAHRWIS
jgi:hypothetical protein